MKHILLSICLLAFWASIANADLRYTMHVRVTSAQLKEALPAGETVMLIQGDAVRVEQVGGAARSVLLMRPDGQFVLDLEARTYWRIPRENALILPATATPSVFRRTGEFATMLGLRAERVDVTMSLPLPVTPPPGLPTVVSMTGELWIADAYRDYAGNISRAISFSSAIPSGIEGIVLRQVVRNAQLGIEIEHRVTELIEAPVAAEMFEVPDGFRDVTGSAGRR